MNNSKLQYEFAPTGGGDETGFNDPVTSTFKGDYSYYLARESIQNIIDAAESFPVKANFELFTINSRQLPRPNQLRGIFEACWRYVKGNPRGKEFFKEAWENLSGNGVRVHVLKISDFNTRGMMYEKGNKECDYYSFIKAVGSSFKSRSAGGSWGLGKGSYFAASTYRTIFVSSVYEKSKNIFQGKLRLSSHKKNGVIMQGNGSFGLTGQKPVTDYDLIPELFRREDQGTDIYIIGFQEPGIWEKSVIKSVLNNFWPAIYKGILEVKVDKEKIYSGNLEQKLKKFYSPFDPDTDKNPNPLPYFYAYTDTKNEVFEEDLPVLGITRLYVLENDKFRNRVACMRDTGMIIQKLARRSTKNFAGVFECNNEKGNKILQRMEGPRHNKWSKNNDQNYSGKPSEDLVKAEDEIESFIRENLNKLIEMEKNKALIIRGLEKYLYIPADTDYISGNPFNESESGKPRISEEEKGAETNKATKYRKETQPKIKPVMQTIEIKEAEEGDGNKLLVGEGRRGEGYRETDNTAVETGANRKVAVPIQYRTFALTTSNNKVEHLLIIRSRSRKKVDIEFRAGVDSGTILIDIKHAENINGSELKTDGYKMKDVDFRARSELRAKVKFNTNERLSLNLRAYENK
jgi:hypothetical protein